MSSQVLKIQRIESELSVHFQIDHLLSHFQQSGTRMTETFGPGLKFGSYSLSLTDATGTAMRYIGLYLFTSNEYPPMDISWTINARSRSGWLYSVTSMFHSFKSGEAIGWSKFMNIETLQNNDVMKAEDTLVLQATLKFAPMFPVVQKCTLDTVHHSLRGSYPPHVRLIAYSRRDNAGKLSYPRALFSVLDKTPKCSPGSSSK